MAKKKTAQDLAFDTMRDARKEAVKKGDVEGLLNISITYFEFHVKMSESGELDNKKKKSKLGFHHERISNEFSTDDDS